jgi:hypothetical protein
LTFSRVVLPNFFLTHHLAAKKAPEANKYQHSCSRAREELSARSGGRFHTVAEMRMAQDLVKAGNFELDQRAPIAAIEDLASYDAIIVGAPTRLGRSQIASFLCFDALLSRRSPAPGGSGSSNDNLPNRRARAAVATASSAPAVTQ